MKTDLTQFEQEFRNKVTLARVNVRDRESELYKKYIGLDQVKYVPHIILVDDTKKVLKKNTGQMSKQQLAEFVKPFVK
jgi:hypothetical protein